MAPAKKRSSFSMLKKAITSSIRFGATDGSEKCPMCLKNVFKVERVVCSGASWHKQCLGKPHICPSVDSLLFHSLTQSFIILNVLLIFHFSFIDLIFHYYFFFWHLVCGGTGDGGCKRKLLKDYLVHHNNPFCRNCYTKINTTGGNPSAFVKF